MKKQQYVSICMLMIISCKKNGQNTSSFPNNDDSEEVFSNSKNDATFSGEYADLLTSDMASRITGFEGSKIKKMHILKGMTGEILRYNWESGREIMKEKSISNRKRVTYSRSDHAQIGFVDFEADKDSFLDFVGVASHPELSKIEAIGEVAYWNSHESFLEVYSNGISFRVMVAISNNENRNKEKTIELARLIIEEQIK